VRFRDRRLPPKADRSIHRGRIFRDTRSGWWRYVCKDCDYGAGSSLDGALVWRWLMRCANDHAHPAHWSRPKFRVPR